MPLGQDDDILGQLLPMLLEQGAPAYEEGEASDAALFGAVAQSPFYRGVPSNSGAGQISEAILPLLAGIIEGKQAERTAKNEALVNSVNMLSVKLKLAELANKIQGASPEATAARGAKAKSMGLEASSMDASGEVKYARPKTPTRTTPNIASEALTQKLGREPSAVELDNELKGRRQIEKAYDVQQATNAVEDRRLNAPHKPPAGGATYNPLTMERVRRTSEGEFEQSAYVDLNGVETKYLQAAMTAFAELNKMDALTKRILRPEAEGLFGVQLNRADLVRRRLSGDSDVKLFDGMKNMQVFNVAKIAQSGSDRLSNVDQELSGTALPGDGDTVESALAKTGNLRQILAGQLNRLGFDPDAISEQVTGRAELGGGAASTSGFVDFEFPENLLPAVQALVGQMQATSATDAEIAKQVQMMVRDAKAK